MYVRGEVGGRVWIKEGDEIGQRTYMPMNTDNNVAKARGWGGRWWVEVGKE